MQVVLNARRRRRDVHPVDVEQKVHGAEQPEHDVACTNATHEGTEECHARPRIWFLVEIFVLALSGATVFALAHSC
jgi:hypothetical protein